MKIVCKDVTQTQVSAFSSDKGHLLFLAWGKGGRTPLQREIYALFLGRKEESRVPPVCCFSVAFTLE